MIKSEFFRSLKIFKNPYDELYRKYFAWNFKKLKTSPKNLALFIVNLKAKTQILKTYPASASQNPLSNPPSSPQSPSKNLKAICCFLFIVVAFPKRNEIYTRISCGSGGNRTQNAKMRNEIKSFYLLLNMLQFTLSTVLYLSINLFKESLVRFNSREFSLFSRRSANKYSSLKVFAFLIKANAKKSKQFEIDIRLLLDFCLIVFSRICFFFSLSGAFYRFCIYRRKTWKHLQICRRFDWNIPSLLITELVFHGRVNEILLLFRSKYKQFKFDLNNQERFYFRVYFIVNQNERKFLWF